MGYLSTGYDDSERIGWCDFFLFMDGSEETLDQELAQGD
jgi:hypothetical protein